MTKTQAAADSRDETSLMLDHVEIEIEAILGARRMTVGELRTLAQDDVLALSASLSDPVELRVNGRTIGLGEIVAVDDHFAVRVTRIGS
jgi:flagellar motor switch protein FliN